MTRDEAVAQALGELELDAAHGPEVVELLETPRAEWPPCCGLLCDPCVLTLGRAAERVRRLCREA